MANPGLIQYFKSYHLVQSNGPAPVTTLPSYAYLRPECDYLIEYTMRSGGTYTSDKFYGKFVDMVIDPITSHDVCLFEVHYSICEWSEMMLHVFGTDITKISDDVLLLEEFSQKCQAIV